MKGMEKPESVADGLDACTYKQLQKLAKENGIRANAKASHIVRLLREKGVRDNSARITEAVVKSTRSGSEVPTASLEPLDGLSRRELQRLAKAHGIRANAKSEIIVQELKSRGYAGPTDVQPTFGEETERSISAPSCRREAILRDRAEKWIQEKQKKRMKSRKYAWKQSDVQWKAEKLAPRALRQKMLEKRNTVETLELPSPVRKALASRDWNVPLTNASNLAKKHRKKSMELQEKELSFNDSSLGGIHKLLPDVTSGGGTQMRKKEYGIKSLRPQPFQGKKDLYMSEVAARRQATLAARRNVSVER